MLLTLDMENVISIFNLAHPLKQVKEPMVKIFFRSIVILLKCGNPVNKRIYAVLQTYEEDSTMFIFIPKDLNEEPWTVENFTPVFND